MNRNTQTKRIPLDIILAAEAIAIDAEYAQICDELDSEYLVIEGAHAIANDVIEAEEATPAIVETPAPAAAPAAPAAAPVAPVAPVAEIATPASKMPVDRAALANRIAAVANSVSGVKTSPWMTSDGKVVRVYITFTRKANGGAGWNGGVGAKTYLDISVENANLIAGGDMGECAVLDVPSSAFAGAATRDMLRANEMKALDEAFTDAGLCIVVE